MGLAQSAETPSALNASSLVLARDDNRELSFRMVHS